MSFIELAGRFRRLRNDPLTDELGTENVRTLEAQAARLYRRHAERGHPDFWMHLPNTDKLPPNPFDDERDAIRLWVSVCHYLALRPKYCAALRGVSTGGYSWTTCEVKKGGPIATAKQLEANWRQRAEDNATVCEILAELAGERAPNEGRKKEGKPASGGKQARKRGRPGSEIVDDIIAKRLYVNAKTQIDWAAIAARYKSQYGDSVPKPDSLRRTVQDRLSK